MVHIRRANTRRLHIVLWCQISGNVFLIHNDKFHVILKARIACALGPAVQLNSRKRTVDHGTDA